MAIPYPHYENNIMVAASNSSSSIPPVILTQDELKKIAAYKAVEFVESGMVVGLGTGSTAKHAVDRIGELLRLGKLENIIGIPTSKKTHEQALSLGIPLSDLDSHPVLDLAIDGADEVDPNLNLVKGRGGSLLREKMVEGVCKKFVVIVDESKLVSHIGGSGLAMPVEIVPFCWKFTAERLKMLFEDSGCVAKLRLGSNGEPFATDNGNYIVDLYFKKDIGDLRAASDSILRLAGVVEHGMFLDMATTVIVAGELGVQGAGLRILMSNGEVIAVSATFFSEIAYARYIGDIKIEEDPIQIPAVSDLCDIDRRTAGHFSW
ncbi:Ribose 5-phosphate isomerase, type A [Dillenia turbinata]|uniref:ribose-5-phosphate isomerase n=1 Tax=Dillenia turbinata TaxID=194707 RepID=A0AAN8VCP5_9MAGN